MIDMVKLLRKNRITFDGPNRRGWLEKMTCPQCGRPHLGWNVDSEVFFCWFCRGLPFLKTLSRIVHQPLAETAEMVASHRTAGGRKAHHGIADDAIDRPQELKWPDGIGELNDTHKRYIAGRGLDPDDIVNQWHVKGTDGRAELAFANRIYAPLYFNGEPVSWQGRSIIKSNKLRYITCADADEVVPSKSLVYGWDFVEDSEAVVVEGLFDVWKGGPGCVHTFGIAWTKRQLLLLSRLSRVVIAFDNEEGAVRAANSLAEGLDGLGTRVGVMTLDSKDFGEMPLDEARQIVKEALASIAQKGATK